MSHCEQANGFSLACVLSCLPKADCGTKAFPHFEQAKGFSPVWVLSWFCKLAILVNALPHLVQTDVFPFYVGPLMTLQRRTVGE